jgi:MOSC domain-containing protein YiiM
MPEVEHIHVAARSGAPMESLDEVAAVAGKGLEGDRNFDQYSKGQITVVSTEELDEAAAEWGQDIVPGSTRRNVTVSGLRLPRDEGARIKLGDVVVEVYRNASPCELMEESVGPGARAALRDRAGIRGLIIEGGTLRVGDPVSLAE